MAKDMAEDNWTDLAPPPTREALKAAVVAEIRKKDGLAVCSLFLNKFALRHLGAGETLGVQIGADGRLRVLQSGAFRRPQMPRTGARRVVLPGLPGQPANGKAHCPVETIPDGLLLGRPLWTESEAKPRAKPRPRQPAAAGAPAPARSNGSAQERHGETENAWEARQVREKRFVGTSWQNIAHQLGQPVSDLRKRYDPNYRDG